MVKGRGDGMSKVIVGRRLRAALQNIQNNIAHIKYKKDHLELKNAMHSSTIKNTIINHALADMARTGLLVPCVDKPKRSRIGENKKGARQ